MAGTDSTTMTWALWTGGIFLLLRRPIVGAIVGISSDGPHAGKYQFNIVFLCQKSLTIPSLDGPFANYQRSRRASSLSRKSVPSILQSYVMGGRGNIIVTGMVGAAGAAVGVMLKRVLDEVCVVHL